ncbi:hypothetical protein CH363_13475 [Leptospira haakeii]|uniref:Uncharacterized protein n=1 Tax=Leptospira haakeii TaxID=2023198 RepID=A0ABX4PII6_9LEPT|nr:hypothetical protein CH363_13475 [Leptospira haakeii]PKA18972.1 hypothetical protein CH377_15370 [Leptospira haakeii]
MPAPKERKYPFFFILWIDSAQNKRCQRFFGNETKSPLFVGTPTGLWKPAPAPVWVEEEGPWEVASTLYIRKFSNYQLKFAHIWDGM